MDNVHLMAYNIIIVHILDFFFSFLLGGMRSHTAVISRLFVRIKINSPNVVDDDGPNGLAHCLHSASSIR